MTFLVIFSVKLLYFIHLLYFGHISDILKIIILKKAYFSFIIKNRYYTMSIEQHYNSFYILSHEASTKIPKLQVIFMSYFDFFCHILCHIIPYSANNITSFFESILTIVKITLIRTMRK